MHVGDIMTKRAASVRPEASVAEAARIMWEHDCGAVPVVDATGEVVGILTDRDVCMAAYTRGVTLHEMRVGSLMSRHVRTCHPDDRISDAERTMAVAKVRRLPVVDSLGHLVGILSLSDIARARRKPGLGRATEHVFADVADTLAAISTPGPAPLAP